MAKRKKGSGLGQAVPIGFDDYQAQDDHRTLTRAAEITQDPARMSKVRQHHVKQTKTLKTMDTMLGGNKIRGNKDYKKLMKALPKC